MYKNIKTHEIVEDDEALDYVCIKCGINFEEVVDNKEQLELKEMLVEWYFSGDWIKEDDEDEEDEDHPDLEKTAILADMLYDKNLDKRMGLI